jgi:hypothetical protein
MNQNINTDIEQLKKELSSIKIDIQELLKRTSNIKAQPHIQGYQGMRLDLNAGFNVINFVKRISDAEARITALETP